MIKVSTFDYKIRLRISSKIKEKKIKVKFENKKTIKVKLQNYKRKTIKVKF